jgi:hypothetical protein
MNPQGLKEITDMGLTYYRTTAGGLGTQATYRLNGQLATCRYPAPIYDVRTLVEILRRLP